MNKELLIPVLSNNIEIHQFSDKDYFIHELDLDHRIKISSKVYELINTLNGEDNLKKISEENDGLEIEVLYDLLFIKLGKYGIIFSKTNEIEIDVTPKKKPSYLQLSFIFIPARVVSMITPYLKGLFNKKVFSTIIPLCILFIGFIFIKNFENITKYTFQGKDFWLFFLFAFISVTFHEFGHVTATEFFGAKQNGIGGGFYIITPVYFADVSDIWKLKINQRIIVNIAGVYFELIICCLYTIVGLIFGKDFFLVIGCIIFIKTLWNLIPFLRSDGYWILTDFLKIPNLYKESNSMVNSYILSILKKGAVIKHSNTTIFLLIYGIFNKILLITFIIYISLYQLKNIITLPYDLYIYFKNLLLEKDTFSIQHIYIFLLPIMFYYLLIKYIIALIKHRKFKSKKR